MNAPPQYYAAEEKFRKARTIEEKIAALEEMLRWLPDHKGTRNMRRVLLQKLARLRREKERKAAAAPAPRQVIRKEAPLVVLLGIPNAGKSTLLNFLTGADAEVAEYPFTTQEPVVGMMDISGGKVQIVEIPAIFEGFSDSKLAKFLYVVRMADVAVLVIDGTKDPEYQRELIRKELEKAGILLNQKPPKIKARKTASGGIKILGESFLLDPKEFLIQTLHEMGIHSAEIVLEERARVQDVLRAFDKSLYYLRAVEVSTKSPVEGTLFFKPSERFKEDFFKLLGFIRVYTKPPRKPPSKIPVILKKGSTIKDLASELGFKEPKGARVWGSAKFPGAKVSLDFVLSDGDIVELLL